MQDTAFPPSSIATRDWHRYREEKQRERERERERERATSVLHCFVDRNRVPFKYFELENNV